MSDELSPIDDLFGLDREVARAVQAIAAWRAGLPSGVTEDDDPFEDARRVSSKATWDALGSLKPSAHDEPLRAGLRRWVLALLFARIAAPFDVARAEEARAARGRYDGLEARMVSWTEAWREASRARTPVEVRRWLDAASEAAPPLADLQRRRAARRLEAAQRAGLAHPWEHAAPVPVAGLRASAARVLDRTEDLSRAVWREALGADVRVEGVIHAAIARDAGDGWPARLTPRWLDETFGSFTRGLALDLPPLPPAAGAASFARALAAFGFAVQVASAERSAPFAIAHEPARVAAHRLGHVTAALAADGAFQIRALGVARRVADAQSRVLARTLLLAVRTQAVCVLLGEAPARDVFDELTARLYGSPVDPRLSGAWPVADDEAPGRWLALLQAPALQRALRDRFDVDWFRNPRAWTHLRGEGASPAFEEVDEATLEPAADAVARSFEEALS